MSLATVCLHRTTVPISQFGIERASPATQERQNLRGPRQILLDCDAVVSEMSQVMVAIDTVRVNNFETIPQHI